MSNKIEETCKTLDQCNGYSSDNIQNPSDNQHIFQNAFPSKLVLDNYNTILEVKIKKKTSKPAEKMVSSTYNREQNTEERQRSNGEHRQNWLQDLQEHTRPYLKKNLQNLSSKNQHTKKISSSECKDNKKLSTPQQKLRYKSNSFNKQLDEVPVKQVPLQKISKEHVKKSQQTGFSSSSASTKCIKCTKSVLVIDEEVQCGGIFDSSYDKYNSLNPVRTLGFLMKELERLIKDEESSIILTKMEQMLIRIPIEFTKSTTTTDLHVLTPHTILDEKTVEIEKMCKQVNTVCGSLREERNALKRDVEKHSKLLEEAQRKQLDSDSTISKLKEQLNEALKTIESKDEVISELQTKLTELRTDLNKQIELTRQSHLELQNVMLERDKLSVINSHKDSQFNEYHHNVMKEFQNEIKDWLDLFKEAIIKEKNANLHGSLVQHGFSCSSPSPTSSDRSNIPTSWNGSLEVSVSLIDDKKKKATSKKGNLLIPSYSRITEQDTAETIMEEINESKNNRDSSQLEFISLPPGESTSFRSYKDQECLDESGINKDKDYLFPSKSKLSDCVQQFVDADSTKSSVPCINENDNENKTYKKHLSKIRKTLQFDNKNKNHDNESIEDSCTFRETNVSGDIITSNISERFEAMFDEVRRKPRISVNVPSPPRNYPHPDWTDSTLPSSVSVDSELNIDQPNII
ncbi:PREDICTED: abnormal long morphology protein 1-like [Polistes dominula]|uniref:Abnormal long morphology protein 1-like n=1 Tax=Polistes dominula TaxID=743375 RepID=A0ABM1ICA4_POLDO|nr:PREDICTED: abnormal long morphology protein 1-like [Polistes dominula]XP_015177841.1 PREDICTED: abnormal long morphology protein 1-like [Polistes dominula]XP_015177842.1 PREDICTED: abnormal long morphology protein 1-like [Polistes dominula]